MATRKPIRTNISSRLQNVLSADERERVLEDSVRNDVDDDTPVFTQHEELEEPPEPDEETPTEMGLHRHTDIPQSK